MTRKHNHPIRWTTDELAIDLGEVTLGAALSMSTGAVALAIAPRLGTHGRRTHRARRLAQALRARRIATLSVDLGSEAPLPVLARRLVAVTDWVRSRPRLWDLPISYIADDASAVALIAAAIRPRDIDSVVTCGGRPTQAGAALARVEAATLLLAPHDDAGALEENRHAIAAMSSASWIEHVPGAGPLADDAHVTDVARRAADWCLHAGHAAAAQTAA